MCFCLYIVGLTLVLLNLAGIGDHTFDRKSLECIWDRMATYYYTVAFSVVLVWVPVAITGILYLNIFITVQRSTQRMKEVTNQNNQTCAHTVYHLRRFLPLLDSVRFDNCNRQTRHVSL